MYFFLYISTLIFLLEQVQEDESARTLHILHEAARNRLTDDVLKSSENEKWNDAAIQKKKRHHHHVGSTSNNLKDQSEQHPGCQLAGHLLLDRVPGNFHILARSNHHDIEPQMTNTSHKVNEFYVGDPTAKYWIQERQRQRSSQVPKEIEFNNKIIPLNNNIYSTKNLHESYHHYIKLVATKIDGMKVGRRELVTYQMTANSQLAYYDDKVTPEAKFVYDISPIAVKYTFDRSTRRWYDYLTSVFAIIGGIFTVVGMLEAFIRGITTSRGIGRKRGGGGAATTNIYRNHH